MGGVVFCLSSCLALGVQYWSLLVVAWSWVFMLRWRSLGELLLLDITWGWEVSGGPMSWTRLSHLRGSGLTPGQSTKSLSATWSLFRRQGWALRETEDVEVCGWSLHSKVLSSSADFPANRSLASVSLSASAGGSPAEAGGGCGSPSKIP